MKNNSSGWIIFGLFALIPAALILGGLIFALLAAARTSTHRISIDDSTSSGHSQSLSVQLDSDRTEDPQVKGDSTDVKAAGSAQGSEKSQDSKDGKTKGSNQTKPADNPDSSKTDDDKTPAKSADDDDKSKSNENDVKQEKNTSKETKRAAVEPSMSFEIPDWFSQDHVAGDSGVFLIDTGLDSPENVEATIDRESLSVVNRYVRTTFGNPCADRVKVDPEYVKNNVIRRKHIRLLSKEEAKKLLGENPTTNDLECVFGYAELEIDEDFDAYVLTMWQRTKQTSRIGQIFLVAGSVFLVLILAFSFFSTDRATRGMYTVRLQLGSLLLVAIAALIIWAAALQIDWI